MLLTFAHRLMYCGPESIKKVFVMINLSIENIRKVQGGGFFSYFYNMGYQSTIRAGSSHIKLRPLYVGSPEALVFFHEKIRQLQHDDAMHNKQLSLMNAQISCAREKTQYYQALRAQENFQDQE